MNKYLITGVSGAGKSTIAMKLQMNGYTALDSDSVPGLATWTERVTGKPSPKEFNSAADWVDRYDWLWNEQRLYELLKVRSHQPLFLCGSSANQEKFYDLFTIIFLLEIDNKTLKHRLLKCDREHEFGRRPGEIEVILGWYKGFQTRIKASGAIIIDAKKPTDESVEQILSHIHER